MKLAVPSRSSEASINISNQQLILVFASEGLQGFTEGWMEACWGPGFGDLALDINFLKSYLCSSSYIKAKSYPEAMSVSHNHAITSITSCFQPVVMSDARPLGVQYSLHSSKPAEIQSNTRNTQLRKMCCHPGLDHHANRSGNYGHWGPDSGSHRYMNTLMSIRPSWLDTLCNTLVWGTHICLHSYLCCFSFSQLLACEEGNRKCVEKDSVLL